MLVAIAVHQPIVAVAVTAITVVQARTVAVSGIRTSEVASTDIIKLGNYIVRSGYVQRFVILQRVAFALVPPPLLFSASVFDRLSFMLFFCVSVAGKFVV